MKRTLLEILGALAVLVLLASFQHQIGRLKEQNIDVATLRDLVEETAANAGSRQDILEIQHRLTELVDDRLALLENKVSNATEKAKEATFLKEELDAARREAALLKAQITRDMTVTRELVDSYHSELRAQDRTVMETLSANRDVLSRISGKVLPDAGQLTRELLSPTVQLNGEDTVGSGTLISSVIDARTGKADSHVLTSYHVVRNILADSPRAKTEGIPITFYRGEEQVQVRADVVSYDEAIDAALLKLRSDETFEPVARVLPREQAEVVKVWDDVYAIGCPLGNDPIPTSGTISSMHNVLSGTNYWMINAPTYYGNSGGGVFLANSRSLIGVFSKIYTHGRGNPVVIPHMGLCTPITAIYDWLEKENLGHILDRGPDIAVIGPTLAAPVK